MSIEAMKQAIEALQGGFGGTKSWHMAIEAAIKELRAAIEQAEKAVPVAYRVDWPVESPIGLQRFFGADDEANMRRTLEFFGGKLTPLYTASQPVQPSGEVTDEQLRAEVEWLRADAERWRWIADGNNFDESFTLLTDPKLTTYGLTKAVDHARTTHKECE